VEPVTDGPSHNTPGEEIENNGQIQPTLSGPDVGEILSAKSGWLG
jgi:hypothetical protein